MNSSSPILGTRWMWGLALVLAFPAALLVRSTNSRSSSCAAAAPLATSVRFVRTWVLSALVLVLFLRWVLGCPARTCGSACRDGVLGCVVIAPSGRHQQPGLRTASQGSWQSRVPKLLRDLVTAAAVATGRALVFSFVWGRELSGALAALGVTSIVVGLALQEPLGNLFSGLMLLMERPFEVGDNVEVAARPVSSRRSTGDRRTSSPRAASCRSSRTRR